MSCLDSRHGAHSTELKTASVTGSGNGPSCTSFGI